MKDKCIYCGARWGLGWVQWRSVQDELPDLEERVLILTSDYMVDIEKRTDPKDGNIWSCISKESVTHWMKLPSIPTPEEKDD